MRRLFVGDIHGCADELAELLQVFGFVSSSTPTSHPDALFSVGDVMGKGPKPRQALEILKQCNARVVLGNHDAFCLAAASTPESERSNSQQLYLESLGVDGERAAWLQEIASWPLYIELPDIILVHAGLEPGVAELSQMRRKILFSIRTWDGKGDDLKSESNPPWFECVNPNKTVVFGHWAKRGLLDLPRFKGLDTGWVYGKNLTGWCPEEDRFYQVPAHRSYAAILEKD